MITLDNISVHIGIFFKHVFRSVPVTIVLHEHEHEVCAINVKLHIMIFNGHLWESLLTLDMSESQMHLCSEHSKCVGSLLD